MAEGYPVFGIEIGNNVGDILTNLIIAAVCMYATRQLVPVIGGALTQTGRYYIDQQYKHDVANEH